MASTSTTALFPWAGGGGDQPFLDGLLYHAGAWTR
jgi:hypothetical protein